ncbi:hypothetical protein AMATHDRAFT_160558 [Amanita thiersii Skay4041]|uniref:Uncharacterized protein n=1 Tax=Amanita thiersii Skay4041 TaxID=703135 RepID=A0A2A9NAU5_9AGAR|nr:hypothetical protein AMATHDRAFT_160558 [Amanita thiersii Skay4041]
MLLSESISSLLLAILQVSLRGIQLISLLIVLCWSLTFVSASFGYVLHVGKIQPLRGSFYRIRYTNPAGMDVYISRVNFTPHLPRPSYPCWGTLTASGYEYKDHECHVTIGVVHVTCWLFPVISRFTSGPWLTTRMEDFRVRVYTSSHTPRWIEYVRRNLIYTILNGDTTRLDDFSAQVTFSNANRDGRAMRRRTEDERNSVTWLGEGHVEALVSTSSERWQIVNMQNRRLYAFGTLSTLLRRNLDGDRGSYQMIAKNSTWTMAARVGSSSNYGHIVLWKVILAFVMFPYDIWRIYRDPPSAVDLDIPRCDLTFDHFRIRDAELVKQVSNMIKRQYLVHSRNGSLDGVSWDMVTRTIVAMCS